MLELAISEKGLVTSAEIHTSSGYPELDRAARKAALTARFSPAKKNGDPVPFTIRQPFEFRLLDR